MRNRAHVSQFLAILLGILLFAGCSSRFDPVGPEAGNPDGSILSPRGGNPSFEELLKASEHGNYTEIGGLVSSATGGVIQGSVSGYDNAFRLDVPAGACPGSSQLRMLVPNEGVPVYQLLPHMTFNGMLTVTLDYSKWLKEGALSDGSLCEVLYMNEASGEFEQLSPRALFVADAEQPTVSFTTNHFSRWWLDGEVE